MPAVGGARTPAEGQRHIDFDDGEIVQISTVGAIGAMPLFGPAADPAVAADALIAHLADPDPPSEC